VRILGQRNDMQACRRDRRGNAGRVGSRHWGRSYLKNLLGIWGREGGKQRRELRWLGNTQAETWAVGHGNHATAAQV